MIVPFRTPDDLDARDQAAADRALAAFFEHRWAVDLRHRDTDAGGQHNVQKERAA